ncbi:MAG: PhzF family phenazine biosynthesis protein [Elainellaceae cyanobacterium]
MGLTILQVDAFTNRPFAGNPAAVCVLPEPQSDEWMQTVASEMNLSETAFLLKEEDGYRLRWFTPSVEVDLCGHATLASAHVLWSEGHLPASQDARFHTKSGLLLARSLGDWIELDFPANPSRDAPIVPPALAKALKGTINGVYQNSLGYLVEIADEESVRKMTPDFSILGTLSVHGVIVTSQGNHSKFDFVSRFFAPGIGINEDPVTGAAHCCLGPFWRDRLGKDEFLAYQASARGGVVKVRCAGERIMLGGQAVTVMKGELI